VKFRELATCRVIQFLVQLVLVQFNKCEFEISRIGNRFYSNSPARCLLSYFHLAATLLSRSAKVSKLAHLSYRAYYHDAIVNCMLEEYLALSFKNDGSRMRAKYRRDARVRSLLLSFVLRSISERTRVRDIRECAFRSVFIIIWRNSCQTAVKISPLTIISAEFPAIFPNDFPCIHDTKRNARWNISDNV